jgi:hypothetical protein
MLERVPVQGGRRRRLPRFRVVARDEREQDAIEGEGVRDNRAGSLKQIRQAGVALGCAIARNRRERLPQIPHLGTIARKPLGLWCSVSDEPPSALSVGNGVIQLVMMVESGLFAG